MANKEHLRRQYPDIAKIVDEIREHMSIEKMVFPYEPKDIPNRRIGSGMQPPFTGSVDEKR